MKAAIIESFTKPLVLQNVPDPTPGKDDVIVGVRANGICRSDWHGWMGHDPDISLPHVPGHELSGVIEAVGKNISQWKPGDRVTVPFSGGCGYCPQCKSGFHNICDNYFQPGFTAWGSFAEFVAIQYAETNLVAIPDEIDFVTASILGCRFITSFRAVVSQGKVRGGDWVAVYGCGGVGLSAIMIAHACGAQVIAIDINKDKLAFAKTMGADVVIDGSISLHCLEKIQDISGGGVHISIDALGSTATCRNSIQSLRKRGKHIQVGLMVDTDSKTVVPFDQVIGKELEIIGSHGMQAFHYTPMLEMIKNKTLQPKKLIGKTVSLSESLYELEHMGEFPNTGMTVINQF